MKFKNYFLLFVLLVLIIPGIFSIECINPAGEKDGKAGVVCSSGTQFYYPQFCQFTIDPNASPSGQVVIEVIQGGRYDNGRNMYINYDTSHETDSRLTVWVDRDTLPIYINCYESKGTMATDGSVGWEKETILQQMSFGKDKGWETSLGDLPEDRIADDLSSLNLKLDSNLSVTKSYNNLDRENIVTKWALGLLLALLGMMVFFDTFWNSRFNRYI